MFVASLNSGPHRPDKWNRPSCSVQYYSNFRNLKIHWHGNQSRCHRVILQHFTQSLGSLGFIGKCCRFSWWNVASWIIESTRDLIYCVVVSLKCGHWFSVSLWSYPSSSLFSSSWPQSVQKMHNLLQLEPCDVVDHIWRNFGSSLVSVAQHKWDNN
jgi:hypothetical protein